MNILLLCAAFFVAGTIHAAALDFNKDEDSIAAASVSSMPFVSGQEFIIKAMDFLLGNQNPKDLIFWHDYNKAHVQNLDGFLQDVTCFQEQDICSRSLKLHFKKEEAIHAAIEELVFIARSEMCTQRSDDGPANGVFFVVDYKISHQAYKHLLAIFEKLQDPAYQVLQAEASENMKLISEYFKDLEKKADAPAKRRRTEKPKSESKLHVAASKLWSLIRDRVTAAW